MYHIITQMCHVQSAHIYTHHVSRTSVMFHIISRVIWHVAYYGICLRPLHRAAILDTCDWALFLNFASWRTCPFVFRQSCGHHLCHH